MLKKTTSLMLGLFLLIATAGITEAGSVKRITGAELQGMMDAGEKLVIVDVREPWLYSKGHIPGAINIQYEDNSKTRVLNELNPKDKIVFVCHGGPMGDDLGGVLIKNGYTDVYNVKRGMRGWNGPLVSE